MSEELYFNNELRKCLNAAGISDCGENDEWNYWYQRVHKAHDQAVDRVTEAQRAENAKLRTQLADVTESMGRVEERCAKLREAVATAIKVQAVLCGDADSLYCRNKCPLHRPESNDCLACDVIGVAQELGIEVMDG